MTGIDLLQTMIRNSIDKNSRSASIHLIMKPLVSCALMIACNCDMIEIMCQWGKTLAGLSLIFYDFECRKGMQFTKKMLMNSEISLHMVLVWTVLSAVA